MNRLICLILAASLLAGSVLRAEDVKPLSIGAAAPNFSLPGVDGKTYSLKDFASAKILVVIFTCNHCPTAQAYEDRIKQMVTDYKDKGVAIVAINPNNAGSLLTDELRYSDLTDSLDDMKIRAKQRQFNFPYLYDGDTQMTAHAYGALATPHVFIFDADRKLRYQGRIDDSDVHPVRHPDARNAIDAILAGQPVPVATTHVFGCSTKWISKAHSAKAADEKWDKEPVSLDPIDAAGVQKLIANESDKLVLINVWATWCAPCIAEMPELLTITRQFRERQFKTIAISEDDPANKAQVLQYMTDHHLAFENYLWNSDDKDALVTALDKNWQGPVPFTLLVAPGGTVIYRQTGAFDPLKLKQAIVDYLGRTYASKPPHRPAN